LPELVLDEEDELVKRSNKLEMREDLTRFDKMGTDLIIRNVES